MNALVTRCDSNIVEMSSITHPYMKDYALKYDMDFVVLDKNFDVPGGVLGLGPIHYRIMHLKELLDTYERVFCIDTDTLILPWCPNIFDEVPKDKIGSCLEDAGSREEARRKRIKKSQEFFGDVGWEKDYINTGAFVVSEEHQIIFEHINGEYWLDYGYDDVHLGYNIKKNNFQLHNLGYKFNHMAMFSEPWHGNKNRFDSYIIHYAGGGIFESGPINRVEQIKLDVKRIYE